MLNLGFKEKNAVEPFNDGKDAWKSGALGYLTRIRGLILSMFSSFILGLALLTGVPICFKSFPKQIPTILVISVFILITCFILFIYLLWARKYSQRNCEVAICLHNTAHYMRDAQIKIYTRIIKKSGYFNYLEFYKQLCEYTKDYFKLITQDETIEAAIRLAMSNDNGKTVLYKTFGRSSGLNANREKNSEDIPANKGIPRYLIEDKTAQGVLIYNDLWKAEKAGTFKITSNERDYPNDINTMMVAPINAWGGVTKNTVGILYVTSRNSDTFSVKYVDKMRFWADFIAISISNSVESNGFLNTINKSRR